MKFLLISPKNRTVWNFRGELIKRIIESGYQVFVTGPDKTDVEKIEELGAEFVEIPMNKNGTNIFADIKYCKALFHTIKKIKPDVILGYTIKPVVYGTIAGWLGGVKNINCLITGGGYTFTSTSFKAKVLGTIVRTLYKFALKHSTHVIFQNDDDKNEFIGCKLVKEEKCNVVNGSGVDMAHFNKVPYPNEICFFMLSRLLKSKGVTEYLEAAKKVKGMYPDVKFALLGKYEDKMQDAISKEYVEDLIQKGIIERFEETSDVRPYYEKCSVYVLPSYREGTPRTVLEAMAMGRPIITTDANGCRSTVVDGKTGFLVPVKDVDAVADKMIYFIENPEQIKIMGEASNEYCADTFDVIKVNSDMLKYMNM